MNSGTADVGENFYTQYKIFLIRSVTVGLVMWCMNLNFEWSSMTPLWQEKQFPFSQGSILPPE
jgi:hypothetical protein